MSSRGCIVIVVSFMMKPHDTACSDVDKSMWDNNFEKLVSYKEKYWKLPPTNEKGLGKWVVDQMHVLKN